MSKQFLLCFFLCWVSASVVVAQKASKKNPKKLAKEAEEFEKAGDYYRAALRYETAFSMKEDKLDYIYKAGVCFMEVRDYANAAKCLEFVKDKNEDFEKPGYTYALALKQTGEYSAAGDAFRDFIRTYSGEDKAKMDEIVDTEIKGCNMAMRAQEHTDENVFIQHLDSRINTDKPEFAPIPFNEGVLYFSSAVNGTSKIYRTQKKDKDKWQNPKVPSIFDGKMEKTHYGNGSFTPDGKRFYFTQCDFDEDNKPHCEIYLMMENEDGQSWSDPIKLPDYINVENATTTHPFVTVDGDKEILYFASNREGGKGALDIWYCTRTANSKGNNFTLPKNLGRNINTPGDEITPFYHNSSQTLYFSSNGRISIGGQDVFKSKGARLKWEVAQNVGFPINSAADDLYYVISESHGGGYVVSNRTYQRTKVSTISDDIFYFGEEKIEVAIFGVVTAEEDLAGTPLTDVNVKLFEMVGESEELVEDRMLAEAQYKFVLEPKKNYVIEVVKEGFVTASFSINTNNFTHSEEVEKDVEMKRPPENFVNLLHEIVPPEYDSQDNPYTLPDEVPIDPNTGEPYEEGTAMFELFVRVADIAAYGTDRKLYYNDDLKETLESLSPWEDNSWANVDPDPDPDPDPDLNPEEPIFKNWKGEDNAYEKEPDISYKVQVAAVRYYKESRYEELFDVPGMRMDFEHIEGGLTRVMLVPEDPMDDGEWGFATKGDALDALIYVFDHTRFDRAFVARYDAQERVGKGFRGWDEEEENNQWKKKK